jgi:hypothetical protein
MRNFIWHLTWTTLFIAVHGSAVGVSNTSTVTPFLSVSKRMGCPCSVIDTGATAVLG